MLTDIPAESPVVTSVQADDAWFANWRSRELSRLCAERTVYADYTGAALYPESLVRLDAERLLSRVLGNPHSEHRPSAESSRDLERARSAILRFLRASPDEYGVILTSNASAACRIVGESFPFDKNRSLLLTADNHNSVNGIREFALRASADVNVIGLTSEMRLDRAEDALRHHARVSNELSGRTSLLAFPAQSNFSGVRHPLSLISEAQRSGWRVLLDAASYLPTADLHLDEIKPDFVALSLYKIIGYPTGLGALVARHDARAELRKPWFGGGTVNWVSVARNRHQLAAGVERFEDGTPNFAAAGIVADCLAAATSVNRGRLARQVSALTTAMLDELQQQRHANGAPLVSIHGPNSTMARGATIACTVNDANGKNIPYWLVEQSARESGIAVRGGCFCNPGCAEHAFDLNSSAATSALDALGEEFTIPKFTERLNGQAVGAIRISFGLGSTLSDVRAITTFLKRYLNS